MSVRVAGRDSRQKADKIVDKLDIAEIDAWVEKVEGNEMNGCYNPCFHVYVSRSADRLRAFRIANNLERG